MTFGTFLKEHRARTGATACEIADACGINRRWYELAKGGYAMRASAATLRTLSEALHLDATEHATLVKLATPPLRAQGPRRESLEIRDSLSHLQHYTRKLRDCSDTDEVLKLVQDAAASLFPEASYLTTATRLCDGGWIQHGDPAAKASRLDAFRHNRDEIVGPIFALEPLEADIITCFPERSLPGDLVTYNDYDERTLAGILGKEFTYFRNLHESAVTTVVRSREGFVGHLYVGDFLKMYDREADRAMLAAIRRFCIACRTH